jgi:hypothetical protein
LLFEALVLMLAQQMPFAAVARTAAANGISLPMRKIDSVRLIANV